MLKFQRCCKVEHLNHMYADVPGNYLILSVVVDHSVPPVPVVVGHVVWHQGKLQRFWLR